VFRQDLRFNKGLNGNVIGGDASNMPIEDGFATKMALHCSFEHFEHNADIAFIKEATRVLRKGGKLCIIPLYMFNKYAIQTDPAVLPFRGIPFDKDAVLYCAKGWAERHGRFYDVAHFVSRIVKNMQELNLTIFVVQNEKKVDSSCYVKFIALFEKE
jgi:ubiquinone/menaquinone biosynthesis C-methylase UbiE